MAGKSMGESRLAREVGESRTVGEPHLASLECIDGKKGYLRNGFDIEPP